MKISVITVARNAEQTIADTLASVQSQRFDDIEHIVIDGASRDRTLAIVDEYRSHLAQVCSEPDRGIYDAMNKGIGLATGEVVGTLNADDVYQNEAILARVAEIFADPGVDACHADLVYVDRADTRRIVRYWTSCEFRPGLFLRGWIPAHPTFFVRREIYERYGTFDLNYRFQSDFELTMRLLEIHRIRSRYVPEVFVRMRMGGVTNNSLGNIIRGNLESYRACKAHGLSVTPWFFVRKISSRIPQFFRRPGSLEDQGMAP